MSILLQGATAITEQTSLFLRTTRAIFEGLGLYDQVKDLTDCDLYIDKYLVDLMSAKSNF